MKYTPLYIKTNNSLLSSMIKIDELISVAKKLNYKSLTITDDNMYGVMDFYYACLKNDIKPIIGLEIKIDDKAVVLYAMDEVGYNNLIKISTIKMEEPLTFNNLKNYSKGLICIVPYTSLEVYNNLERIYANIFKSYKNKEEFKIMHGSNIIYMNETVYLYPEDKQYIDYLYAIRDGKTIDGLVINNFDNHLFSYEDIIKNYPENIDNNNKIFEMCNLKIKKQEKILPVYSCPNNMNSFEYLKYLCREGLRRIFGSTVKKNYVERLKYELEIINKMDFCDYFLIVWDYVKFAKDKGILVGPGRGSAAGSLVSYLLNITTVDPIKYNLLFERFLNPERITMPDIDIDFEYTKREDVINYCIEKYGAKKVVPIITFGTLAAKQAIRDVGRVINVDLSMIDNLCKLIDSRMTLNENYQKSTKIKDFLTINQELKKLYKIAIKFEGLKRHSSIHAAGIVMSRVDLDEVIPLDKGHGSFYTTAYDMTYLEDLGLLKMDFLGIRNLTLINNVIKEIGDLDLDKIPINDEEAIKIFTDANTIGIFQFESEGMMNFLRKFKPSNFEDIFAAIALFRPGPMKNIDSYIKRKSGLEKISYIDDSLIEILKPTYGIIVYQEQIMQIANVLASYSLGEADVLRRAMSKKQENILVEEKEKFITRSVNNGYSEEIATKVYNLILRFASYGFNRAHSVAYAMVSYKMAYLKAHYPSVFMKHLLSMVIGSEHKTKEYIYECKKNNINVLKPDINLSGKDYIIEKEGIRFPLTSIKNLGISAVNAILEERRKHPFKDIFDFVQRCYGKSINRKVIESLIDADAFSSFKINKRTLYNNLDAIINYSEIGDLFNNNEALKPIINYVNEYSEKELMTNELAVFGFYLSNHPVTKHKIKYDNIVEIKNINQYVNTYIETIIYVDKTKEISTKKNDKMLFITGSDELANIDLVLFPKVYQLYPLIEVGDILYIKGKVEQRFNKYQIIVNEIKNNF